MIGPARSTIQQQETHFDTVCAQWRSLSQRHIRPGGVARHRFCTNLIEDIVVILEGHHHDPTIFSDLDRLQSRSQFHRLAANIPAFHTLHDQTVFLLDGTTHADTRLAMRKVL